MKKILANFAMILSLAVVVSVTSCTSYKKVPYLQNSKDLDTLVQKAVVYEPVIQPDDVLNITIANGQEQKAADAYNLTVSNSNGADAATYIVNTAGCVNVPNVGEVCLAGLTIPQAENLILDKVKGAFAFPPTVIVRFASYEISVLGEVTRPGIYNSKNGKISIFQALAQAGDLTVYGKRDNVKIIREEANGEKKVYEVNLNDAFLLTSPLYYLQRNDVVYVTPNKPKSRNADMSATTTLWFTGTSLGVTIINLILNLSRNR